MNKKTMIIALSLAAAVALAGCSAIAGGAASGVPSVQSVSVTTGDVVKAVSGSGVLKFVDSVEQQLPADVKITNVAVKAGDTVQTGDTIASFDATLLSASIANLSASVTQLQQQEQGLALSFQTEKTLYAGMKGRVKEVYVNEGDSIEDVVAEKGGIALISVDGLMTVTFAGSGVAADDEVTVVSDSYSCKGNVSRADGTSITITFTDAKILYGSTVSVYRGGSLIGSGAAQIDLPYLLPAESGIVTDVKVKANDQLTPFTPVVHIKYIAMNESYRAVLDQLTKTQSDLAAAKALRDQGAILAGQDGVVASVLPKGTYPSGTDVVSLYPAGQFEFTVSVDELDVFSVAVGQSAEVQFDGIPDKTFDATVTKISSAGQVANGFTTYALTLSVIDDGTLRSGLNGTVSIVVGQRSGVLILPVEAVSEDADGSYVTLKDSPQTKVPVQVGLSDGRSVEILSGLSAGDTVVIPTAADIGAAMQ